MADDSELRERLDADPPRLQDFVDSPWLQVPDLREFNGTAYDRIVRDLHLLRRDALAFQQVGKVPGANTRGVLMLGEAGTGKTHLLMRLAFSGQDTHYLAFIRRPNQREVAFHVWTNILKSLARTDNARPPQLHSLLQTSFARILSAKLREDAASLDKGDARRQQWLKRLDTDPSELGKLAGAGAARADNLGFLRRSILRFLQDHHQEADQLVVSVLLSWVLLVDVNQRRALLNWLMGVELTKEETTRTGLPVTWTESQDSAETLQEKALRAIQTLGWLSLYDRPIIVGFDQLEGLRNDVELSVRWADTVREIFTMAPNLLLVTGIFPSLWSSWFANTIDDAAKQRISQRMVRLDSFTRLHAHRLLERHLAESVAKHQLPSRTYPFTNAVIDDLYEGAQSPRVFLQRARRWLEDWLDEVPSEATALSPTASTKKNDVDTFSALTAVVDSKLTALIAGYREKYDTERPNALDFIGRVRTIIRALFAAMSANVDVSEVDAAHFVFPSNLVTRPANRNDWLCIAAPYEPPAALFARVSNLREMQSMRVQFTALIATRDARLPDPPEGAARRLREIETDSTGHYVRIDRSEFSIISAIYDLIVMTEQGDLTIDSQIVDARALIDCLKKKAVFGRSVVFVRAIESSPTWRAAVVHR